MAAPIPSNGQTHLQTFARNFYTLAEQRDSLFSNTPAVKVLNFTGNRHNLSRLSGNVELIKTVGLNPEKSYSTLLGDSRMVTKDRYTKSYIQDNKDIREKIADPTSDIYGFFLAGVNRLKDRLIVEACTGDVLTGDSKTAGVLTTAAEDGVITLDGTAAGITYDLLTTAHENFINNSIGNVTLESSNYTLGITGHENTGLLREEKFINNNYIVSKSTPQGAVNNILGINILPFAGSRQGGITIADPIIPENAGVRDCIFMAEEAVMIAVTNIEFIMKPSLEKYVDSSEISVILNAVAVRMDGKRIQIIQTTI